MNDEHRADGGVADSFEEQWRQRFTRFASDNEDDAGIAGWSVSGLQARVRRFVSVWPGDRPNSIWLDAGCGAGTYVRYLQQRGIHAIGLDYSATSVLKARERVTIVNHWLVGDVTSLPVKQHSMDGALCFGVTQALSTSASAVQQLALAVKPGGQAWIDGLNSWCVPHAFETLLRRMRGRPTHVRYESPYRLRRLLREHGFKNVKIHWLPILPARFRKYQWIIESFLARRLFAFVPGVGALLSHSMIVSGTRDSRSEQAL